MGTPRWEERAELLPLVAGADIHHQESLSAKVSQIGVHILIPFQRTTFPEKLMRHWPAEQ
jgi:hypothetical protein